MRFSLLLFLAWFYCATPVRAQTEPTTRIGGTVGYELMRSFGGRNVVASGGSLSLTFKFEGPTGVAQIGFSGWPTALHLGDYVEDGTHRFKPWELFIAASIFPWSAGPFDFGFYLLLTTQDVIDSVAERAGLGFSVQWSLDRMWAVRYQLGCSGQTNFESAALVSTLSLDMVFPYE